MSLSSDDEDDDLLMTTPVFTKKSRAVQRKERQRQSLLEEALADSDRAVRTRTRMAQLQREHPGIQAEDSLTTTPEVTTAPKRGAPARVDVETQATLDDNNNSRALSQRQKQDLKDEMEGLFPDPDQALSRKRRKELAMACDSNQTNLFGRRPVLAFNATRWAGQGPFFFTSVSQAYQALDDLLQETSIKSHDENTPPEELALSGGNRGQDEHATSFLVLQEHLGKLRRMQKEQPQDLMLLLPHFLLQRRLTQICRRHDIPALPPLLTAWLVQVAVSGEAMRPFAQNPKPQDHHYDLLAVAARDALLSLMRNNKVAPSPLPFMGNWSNVHSLLTCWIPESSEPSRSRDDPDTHLTVGKNLSGLKSFFFLWQTSLRPGGMVVTMDDLSIIAQCLVALLYCRLDPSVVSSTFSMDLMAPWQSLLVALLDQVSTFLSADRHHHPPELDGGVEKESIGTATSSSRAGDHHVDPFSSVESPVLVWLKQVAQTWCDRLDRLPTGTSSQNQDEVEGGGDDAEDTQGFLCLPAMIRQLSKMDPRGRPHLLSCHLQATLAGQSLQRCLQQDLTAAQDVFLPKIGYTNLLERARSSSSSEWNYLAISLTALLCMDSRLRSDAEREGDHPSLLMEVPRLLASVECAFLSVEAAMLLLVSSNQPSSSTSSDDRRNAAPYGSLELAAEMGEFLEALETVCRHLSSTVTGLSCHPLYRRLDHLLKIFGVHFHQVRSDIATLLGQGVKTPVQTNLSSFFNVTALTTYDEDDS